MNSAADIGAKLDQAEQVATEAELAYDAAFAAGDLGKINETRATWTKAQETVTELWSQLRIAEAS